MSKFPNPYFPLADPFVLYHEGTYYLYGTTDVEEELNSLNDFSSSDDGEDGFFVYTSKDLIEWKKEGYCLKKGDAIGEKWFWAPEVYYRNGRFYMAYSAEEHIAIAVSDSPLGPFKQEEKKWLREEPAIDLHILFDDDGKKYAYFVGFNEGNRIYCARLNDDMRGLDETTTVELIKAEDGWEQMDCSVVEGPFVLKREGIYYLTYSANHTRSEDYAVGYATSSNPVGPFIKSPDNPILKKGERLKGTGHHSFSLGEKGELLCVFHCHNPKGKGFRPRHLCLSYARFLENGALEIDKPE